LTAEVAEKVARSSRRKASSRRGSGLGVCTTAAAALSA